jgi:starvation-inducible DNA-binding protein
LVQDTNEPDPTTANLLQEVELGVDKYQWQMRAHVQRTSTDPNTGWDLNDNKAVDLPSRTPPAQPEAD